MLLYNVDLQVAIFLYEMCFHIYAEQQNSSRLLSFPAEYTMVSYCESRYE